MKKQIQKLLTSSTLGVQIFFVLSLLLISFTIFHYEVDYKNVLAIIVGYFLYGCLGVVVAFHRFLTHQSFTVNNLVIKFFTLLGCFSGTGSPIAWTAIHINHHLKSDTDLDPHSPHYKGFRIFLLNYSESIDNKTKWRMRHLFRDNFYQFCHRYYFGILLAYGISLYLIGGLQLLVFFFLAPAVITAFMSNIVNYVGHKPILGGSRKYQINDFSSNNWLWAIPSWGESWHNNHHRFPKRYHFGEQWWQIDISGLIIKMIKNDKIR